MTKQEEFDRLSEQIAENHVRSEAPRWWKCDIHGSAKAREWGCPECVREMRADIESVLRYCRGVEQSGTPNEKAMAQTVARMLSLSNVKQKGK